MARACGRLLLTRQSSCLFARQLACPCGENGFPLNCKQVQVTKNAFYLCAIVLFVADVLTLLLNVRGLKHKIDGRPSGFRTTPCILGNSSQNHMTWQTLITFPFDLRVTINLVLAVVRLASCTVTSTVRPFQAEK